MRLQVGNEFDVLDGGIIGNGIFSSCTGNYLAVCQASGISILGIADGNRIGTLTLPDSGFPMGASWSPTGDDRMFETPQPWSLGQGLRMWNPETGDHLGIIGPDEFLSAAAWTGDGTAIVSDGGPGTVLRVYDSQSGDRVHDLIGGAIENVHEIAFGRGDHTHLFAVAGVSNDHTRFLMDLWDYTSSVVVDHVDAGPVFSWPDDALDSQTPIAWSPTRATLACPVATGDVRLWSADSLDWTETLDGRAGVGILHLSWSPDGCFLAAHTSDSNQGWRDGNGLVIWDVATGARVIDSPMGEIFGLDWSGPGLALASGPATVTIYDFS